VANGFLKLKLSKILKAESYVQSAKSLLELGEDITRWSLKNLCIPFLISEPKKHHARKTRASNIERHKERHRDTDTHTIHLAQEKELLKS